MYEVSDNYITNITSHSRKIAHYGTITTKDGATYKFTDANIEGGTGAITRRISGDNAIEIGTVYAAELDISFLSLIDGNGDVVRAKDLDRYKFYDAVVVIKAAVNAVETALYGDWWGYEDSSWSDLTAKTWNALARGESSKRVVPLGRFRIAQTARTANELKIVGYDNMLRFDKTVSMPSGSKTPFQWLTYICNKCGVTLAATEWDCFLLANGTRKLAFAKGVAEDVSTWRDVLAYLCAATASVAYINREGKLMVQTCGNICTSIPANRRFASELTDYKTYYTGMYATYKAAGESEYFSNTSATGADDGLVYNIGVNPFLQITNTQNRQAAVQNILDTIATMYLTPFNADIPARPEIDIGDMVAFTGNQASANDYSVITSLTYNIHGGMEIACGGDNPKLNVAKNRYTKNIEGLLAKEVSGQSVGSTEPWLITDETNAAATITTKTMLNSLDFATSVEVTRVGVAFTATYNLSGQSLVTGTVELDNVSVYEVRELQTAGRHTLTITTGIDNVPNGEHRIAVYLTCAARQAVNPVTGIAAGTSAGKIEVTYADGTTEIVDITGE